VVAQQSICRCPERLLGQLQIKVAESGSDCVRDKSMAKQFSSALRKSEFDSRNAHILTLVEPTRDQGKVALRVEALSKRYGEMEAVADVSF